jgi:hypothetical protein
MEKKEKQNRKVDVVTDVICDSCGESCKIDSFVIDNEKREDHGEMHYKFEYMELSANWGFDSGKDTETWKAQVCEKCVDEKFGFITFKKTNYM